MGIIERTSGIRQVAQICFCNGRALRVTRRADKPNMTKVTISTTANDHILCDYDEDDVVQERLTNWMDQNVTWDESRRVLDWFGTGESAA